MIQYNCKQNFQKDKFTYCIAIGSVMIVKASKPESFWWFGSEVLVSSVGKPMWPHLLHYLKNKNLKGEVFIGSKFDTSWGGLLYCIQKSTFELQSTMEVWGQKCLVLRLQKNDVFIYWMTVALLAFFSLAWFFQNTIWYFQILLNPAHSNLNPHWLDIYSTRLGHFSNWSSAQVGLSKLLLLIDNVEFKYVPP